MYIILLAFLIGEGFLFQSPGLFAFPTLHEEPRKVPFLIILSDGCYTQFPGRILPPTSCMLAGVGLAVIGSDLHRGDETMLNFVTVC